MAELPHPILETINTPKEISKHLSAHLDLLRELTNFGSNLIFRALNSSAKEFGDVMLCGSLLRHFTSMIDTTDVLLRAGCVHASHLTSRSAFEASLYIEWMLASDLDKKAKYYYVGTMRKERLWANRTIAGTPERENFDLAMGKIGEEVHRRQPNLSADGRIHLAEVNAILSSKRFVDIDISFETFRKRTKRGYEPDWYQPLGIKNVRDLARQLHRLPEYNTIFTSGSEVVHGSSFNDNVKFAASGVKVKGLRGFEGAGNILNFSCSCALIVFQRVLGYYRPNELPIFWNKYLEEWRTRFVSIPEVHIVQGVSP